MRSIDVALVARTWLLGRHIVTYEQNGSDRAQYGDKVIYRLARQLEIKGVSATNIRKFRQLYLEYPIQQSLSVELKNAELSLNLTSKNLEEVGRRFNLSWTHYVALLAISDRTERTFYETESKQSSWSVRELERQVNSSLYERLAL